MKLILRQIALVLTFLIIFPAGLSQHACAATETATKQRNTKTNTHTKKKPKPILAPMARRIDKKVHASYKLPQVSLNNRQVRDIINRMSKGRKDKDVYYAVYDISIVDSENTAYIYWNFQKYIAFHSNSSDIVKTTKRVSCSIRVCGHTSKHSLMKKVISNLM